MKRNQIKFHTLAIENDDHEILEITLKKALTLRDFINYFNRILSCVNERVGQEWTVVSHR